jgi:hypothetical protein
MAGWLAVVRTANIEIFLYFYHLETSLVDFINDFSVDLRRTQRLFKRKNGETYIICIKNPKRQGCASDLHTSNSFYTMFCNLQVNLTKIFVAKLAEVSIIDTR